MIEAHCENALSVGDLIPSRGKYQLVLDVTQFETADEQPKTMYRYHFVWVEPNGADLISMKNALVDAVKRIYDGKIDDGYLTALGFRVDIKQVNVVDWSASLQMLQVSGETEIEVGDYDNQTHVISSEDYAMMCLEMGAYLRGLRSRKWTNRNAVLSAESISAAAVAASDWSLQ